MAVDSPVVASSSATGDNPAALDGARQGVHITIAGFAIPRLDDSSFAITPIAPQFSNTVSDMLGNMGDDTDGWDDLFIIPAAAIAGDTSDVENLLDSLVGADFNEGDFDTAAWQPVADAIPGFHASGDNILGAFADAVTPPDSGGTGGGGTGGGGAGGTGAGSGGGGNPGAGGTGGGTGPQGSPPEEKCRLVVHRDGSSEYVCQETGGGVSGPPQPLQQ